VVVVVEWVESSKIVVALVFPLMLLIQVVVDGPKVVTTSAAWCVVTFDCKPSVGTNGTVAAVVVVVVVVDVVVVVVEVVVSTRPQSKTSQQSTVLCADMVSSVSPDTKYGSTGPAK